MGQKERDRLKILHEVRNGSLTQIAAAVQLKLSVRQVRRLVKKMGMIGDRAVVHGLRGRTSNRRVDPTYAAEHLSKSIGEEVGRDTVRKWMVKAGMWEIRRRKVSDVHVWRRRRSCCGELVQWDTSVHAWLEDRG